MLGENVLWQVVRSLSCGSDWMFKSAARLTRQLWLTSSTNQQSLKGHSSVILTPVMQLQMLICWSSKQISGLNKYSCLVRIYFICFKLWNTVTHLNSKISKTHHFNQCWGPLSCKLGPYSRYPKQIIFIRFPKQCHWFVKLWVIMKLSG